MVTSIQRVKERRVEVPALTGPYSASCPTRTALDTIADRWTTLVIPTCWTGSAALW